MPVLHPPSRFLGYFLSLVPLSALLSNSAPADCLQEVYGHDKPGKYRVKIYAELALCVLVYVCICVCLS